MFLDEQYSELQGGSYPSGAIPHRLQTLPSCSILVGLQEWHNLHSYNFGGKISDEKAIFTSSLRTSQFYEARNLLPLFNGMLYVGRKYCEFRNTIIGCVKNITHVN
jgi:hypothetical protein